MLRILIRIVLPANVCQKYFVPLNIVNTQLKMDDAFWTYCNVVTTLILCVLFKVFFSRSNCHSNSQI